MAVFSPGLRLRDRFTLVERVGVGGMSEVWRADDELLGRSVAVKVLATPLARDPALRAAIWREARAVARLSHPHLTQVHDYGEFPLPDGEVTGYLVLELVAGQSLADRLATGPLPWPEAVRVTGQVAAALAVAHQAGVVHRDIKPGNVMLTAAGVKVLDFGIAAVVGRRDTDPGQLAGTPTYTAPERLDPAIPPTPASDVYSLGVLLYEALTGRPPAVLSDWAEAVAAHRAGLPTPVLSGTGLPETVAELGRSCLSPDPAQRPTAAQVAVTLTEPHRSPAGIPAPRVAPGRTLPATLVAPARSPAGSGPDASPAAIAAEEAATGVGPDRYAPGVAPSPAPATAPFPPPGGLPPIAPPPIAPPPGGPSLGGPPRSPYRRWRSRLLVAASVAVALVVLLVAATVWRTGDPDLPGNLALDPAGTGPATPELPASTPVPAPPAPASPPQVLAALETLVTQAFEAEALTREARDELRDELDDLRDALREPDPAEAAEELAESVADLRKEIDELRQEGELDQAIAVQLHTLLDQLPVD